MKILLTGGSGCGKSTYGESLALKFPLTRYYIAAMKPYGEESERKIARHRIQRDGKGFITFERYTDVGTLALPSRGTALLECMCNLTANEMFTDTGEIRDVYDKILSDIRALCKRCDNIIVITNDVGSDTPESDEATRYYINTLGRLNSTLAAEFDAVAELVCGIPILLKGELP